VAVEVDLVEVVEATALVVEMVEEFVSGGVATMRPPLDTFQWTGVPLRGAPSSIVLTDIMAVWFMKIFGGPPLIVMTRGYGRKVIDIEATERPGVEIVRIVVPGTTGATLTVMSLGRTVLFEDEMLMFMGALARAGPFWPPSSCIATS
jgi:hypothetical protein